MVAIPFPTSTNPGEKPPEGTGRLINVYAETKGQNEVVWHRSPGLIAFGSDLGSATWRSWSFPFEEWFGVAETSDTGGTYLGGVLVNNTLYARFGTAVKTVDETGAPGDISSGTLSGSDKTHFARNNASTPDVVLVANDGPFIISSGTMSAYSSTDNDIGSPNSVCFHDSYFMFGYGSGKLQASGVNATSINPLDFTTTESNPDGITRVWSFRGLLYAAGPATIEIYGPPVNAEGFPLTRQGYNITPGLITPWAVAGFEPEFGNFPIYVGSDNTVRWLKGSAPEKISPPDLDFLIASVEDKSDIEALCYISRGNAFWQISSDTFTWVFNINNQTWHERESYGLDRSRMTLSIYAFDSWLTGDTEANDLLQVESDTLTEADEPLIATIESNAVKGFPNRIRVPRADFDFTVGVGDVTGTDPIETDPTVMISWSDDGGRTWSNPRNKKLGEQAEYGHRVTVYLTGISGPIGRRWRLAVSDPVHFGLLGGDMSAELRTK
jgi:hypothetical protein